MGMMEEFYRKVATDKQRNESAEAELEAARLDIVLAERERQRLCLENANLRNDVVRHWQTAENLAASCNAAREVGEEVLGWLKTARAERDGVTFWRDQWQDRAVKHLVDLATVRRERDSARVLLRELVEEAQSIIEHLESRPAILADDPRLARVRSILRRVEAEAGEETKG